MPEQLIDRILGEIRERLDASRDAYEESRTLEAALVALGEARPEPRSRTRSARSSSRAPRGENLRRIREVVAERPGATAGEIASATGIARSTVASTLGKLARDGELKRAELPSGRVGYRPASKDAARSAESVERSESPGVAAEDATLASAPDDRATQSLSRRRKSAGSKRARKSAAVPDANDASSRPKRPRRAKPDGGDGSAPASSDPTSTGASGSDNR